MDPLGLASTHYNRVVLGLLGLALILISGTAGYMVIEGWSLSDAFYMSAITITTVGYREVEPLSEAGRQFTIVLLFFGVGAAFYILTTMVAAIIEGDLRQVFGARRVKLMIERLRDHYIVCSFGRVGEPSCSRTAEPERAVRPRGNARNENRRRTKDGDARRAG